MIDASTTSRPSIPCSRTPIRSSSQNDLVAFDDLTGPRHLKASDAASLTDYAVDGDAISDGEVRPASGRVEIHARRALTDASQAR
jgi:hypothetical protein